MRNNYIQGDFGTIYHTRCPNCNQAFDDHLYCGCGQYMRVNEPTIGFTLTERMRLIRNDKKWLEDIESRRLAPDGKVVKVPKGQKVPWE